MCARGHIREKHPNGDSVWTSLEDHIEIVLSHPNGWEGLQQSKMRQAAVKGRLIPDTPIGHSRICFITEGEASLNYCIESGLLSTETLQVRLSCVFGTFLKDSGVLIK